MKKVFLLLSCFILVFSSMFISPVSAAGTSEKSFFSLEEINASSGRELGDGKISVNGWYTAGGDYMKYPNTAWGTSPLWGHIKVTRSGSEPSIIFSNTGADINPASLSYILGTTARSDLPNLKIPVCSALKLKSSANCGYKFILSYGAINPDDKTETFGYLEIGKDSEGNYITTNTVARDNDFDNNIIPFDKTTNLMTENAEFTVSLEKMSMGIENCTEARIYAVQLVVDAEKAYTLSLNEFSIVGKQAPFSSVVLDSATYTEGISSINFTLPHYYDLSALTPEFRLEGDVASYSPVGPQNFKNGAVLYSFTFNDGSISKYALSAKNENLKYVDFSSITGNRGGKDGGYLLQDTWYCCGAVDPIKYPYESWGLDGMWGHISAEKNGNTVKLTGNGSDSNPASLRYLFYADNQCSKQISPTDLNSYLYFDINSDCDYKFIIVFAAVNPTDNSKKYGLAEIYKDENGKTSVNISEAKSGEMNTAFTNKEVNTLPNGRSIGLLPLESLSFGTEDCKEAYIYSIDFVPLTERAFTLTMNFTPDSAFDDTACELSSLKIGDFEAEINDDSVAVSLPLGFDIGKHSLEYVASAGAWVKIDSENNKCIITSAYGNYITKELIINTFKVCGDLNSSGKLESEDLVYCRKALLGIMDYRTDIFDVNNDTSFDIRDMVALKKLISEAVNA